MIKPKAKGRGPGLEALPGGNAPSRPAGETQRWCRRAGARTDVPALKFAPIINWRRWSQYLRGDAARAFAPQDADRGADALRANRGILIEPAADWSPAELACEVSEERRIGDRVQAAQRFVPLARDFQARHGRQSQNHC